MTREAEHSPEAEAALPWRRPSLSSLLRALSGPFLLTFLTALILLCLAIIPETSPPAASLGSALVYPRGNPGTGVRELRGSGDPLWGSAEPQQSAPAVAAAEVEAASPAGAAAASSSGAAEGARADSGPLQKAEDAARPGGLPGRVAEFEKELMHALIKPTPPHVHDLWAPSTPEEEGAERDGREAEESAGRGKLEAEGREGVRGNQPQQAQGVLGSETEHPAVRFAAQAWQTLQSLWPKQAAGDKVGDAERTGGQGAGAEEVTQGPEQGPGQTAGQGADQGAVSGGEMASNASAIQPRADSALHEQSVSESQSQAQSPSQLQSQAQAQPQLPPKSQPQPQLPPNSQSQGQAGKQGPMDPELKLALRIIESNIKFPGAKRCGAWATSFAALQTSIRSGKRSPRYVLLSGQEDQGMGDRILGLVSSFMVALLTSRALVVNDSLLSTAFEPGVIDWRIRDDFIAKRNSLKHEYVIPPPHEEDTSKRYPELGSSSLRLLLQNGSPIGPFRRRYQAQQGYIRFPHNILEYFSRFNPAPILEVQTNGGVLSQVLPTRSATSRKLAALGLRLQTAYPCILRFLLRPVRQVWEPIAPTAVALGVHLRQPSFCVHMRLTDDEIVDASGGDHRGNVSEASWKMLQELFKCVNHTTGRMVMQRAQLSKMKIFFMTGSREMRESLRERKGVVVSPVVPHHVASMPRSEEEQRQIMYDTVKDWLLFSLCQYHMIDKSGFSKTAMAYSSTRRAIFSHPQLRTWGPGLGRCNGKSPDSLQSVGAFWSGL